MHLTPRQVCDAEYRSALRSVRPSASQESGPRSVTAPRPVKARRGTRNRVQWQQIALHLEGGEVRP